MIKLVALLTRRPDLTPDAFRDYYEARHVPLIVSINRWMYDYRRSYVDRATISGGLTAAASDWQPEFDVITEVWFQDADAFAAARVAFIEPANAARIAADEERFIDRTRKRIFLVEEHGA